MPKTRRNNSVEIAILFGQSRVETGGITWAQLDWTYGAFA